MRGMQIADLVVSRYSMFILRGPSLDGEREILSLSPSLTPRDAEIFEHEITMDDYFRASHDNRPDHLTPVTKK